MMHDVLPKVLTTLANRLTEHKAVSGEELMLMIDQEINRLPADTKKQFIEHLGDDVNRQIFDSITGKDRISVFCPDMHVRLNHLGEIFYCPPSHKYMPDELEKGFKRLALIRFADISQAVEGTLCDLMIKSGYEISEAQSQITGIFKSIKAIKNGVGFQLLIFPSIVFLPDALDELKRIDREHIAVVPSENSPAPFVGFFRENMDRIKDDNRLMIWVVDPGRKTISPFVGVHSDKEVWNSLKDPEKALQAAMIWEQEGLRSRVLDEKV